jgi:two-component system, OmpR family, phosphate regulon sensor histidine kinase PhoR
MFERRSLGLPITLAVMMFVVLLALTVGWVLLNVFVMAADERRTGLYLALLSVGSVLLTSVIVGTALYLTLTIKAISLSQRQSNFIDSVTHELKSPIASLKLYLQTLNRRHVSAAEQEAFYKDMLEDVERLDQLINHLLDAARLEKDRVGPPPGDVRLDEVIRSCATGVCLRHHVPADVVQLDLAPCLVQAATVDLELVFRNLIDNAVKYADDDRPEGKVTLRADTGGQVVARVSDNGRGIPPPLRKRLFGRFVRAGSELERDKPGTGLGLYIVQTMIGRLGGKIRVRDHEGASGATFEVQLPGKPIEEPGRAETSDRAA